MADYTGPTASPPPLPSPYLESLHVQCQHAGQAAQPVAHRHASTEVAPAGGAGWQRGQPAEAAPRGTAGRRAARAFGVVRQAGRQAQECARMSASLARVEQVRLAAATNPPSAGCDPPTHLQPSLMHCCCHSCSAASTACSMALQEKASRTTLLTLPPPAPPPPPLLPLPGATRLFNITATTLCGMSCRPAGGLSGKASMPVRAARSSEPGDPRPHARLRVG